MGAQTKFEILEFLCVYLNIRCPAFSHVCDVSSFPWIFCGFPVFLWFSLILCFFCQVSATRLLFDVLQVLQIYLVFP